MLNEFSRTELLLGSDGMAKLNHSRVAVFGIGGVGTFAVEAEDKCPAVSRLCRLLPV